MFLGVFAKLVKTGSYSFTSVCTEHWTCYTSRLVASPTEHKSKFCIMRRPKLGCGKNLLLRRSWIPTILSAWLSLVSRSVPSCLLTYPTPFLSISQSEMYWPEGNLQEHWSTATQLLDETEWNWENKTHDPQNSININFLASILCLCFAFVSISPHKMA